MSHAPLVLEARKWDTKFFQFPVCQFRTPRCEASELESALRKARARGFQLAYLVTGSSTSIPERIVKEYRGRLVDEKVTFEGCIDRMVDDSELIARTQAAVHPGRAGQRALTPAPAETPLLGEGQIAAARLLQRSGSGQ